MNALLEKLNIKKDDVKVTPMAKAKGKESGDTTSQRNVREKMNMTFSSFTSLISANYYEAIYQRDENNRFLLDKKGNKVIEHYIPKSLNGAYLIEDNGDGTHTATKFNVYKETYLIDSESMNEVKVTS